jgi:AcrR family transcriptional regulator
VILSAAIEAASRQGLQSLTIGSLADRTGLSKSGLFAHFGSKQELQLATLRAARCAFETDIVRATQAAPAGVARLIALTEAYLASVEGPHSPGRCVLSAAASDMEGLALPVRAAVARLERRMFAHLLRPIRMARSSGELAPNTDPRQLAFEIHALLAAADHWARVAPEGGGLTRARRAIENVLLRAAQAG